MPCHPFIEVYTDLGMQMLYISLEQAPVYREEHFAAFLVIDSGSVKIQINIFHVQLTIPSPPTKGGVAVFDLSFLCSVEHLEIPLQKFATGAENEKVPKAFKTTMT